jgi:hypothetical protein
MSNLNMDHLTPSLSKQLETEVSPAIEEGISSSELSSDLRKLNLQSLNSGL